MRVFHTSSIMLEFRTNACFPHFVHYVGVQNQCVFSTLVHYVGVQNQCVFSTLRPLCWSSEPMRVFHTRPLCWSSEPMRVFHTRPLCWSSEPMRVFHTRPLCWSSEPMCVFHTRPLCWIKAVENYIKEQPDTYAKFFYTPGKHENKYYVIKIHVCYQVTKKVEVIVNLITGIFLVKGGNFENWIEHEVRKLLVNSLHNILMEQPSIVTGFITVDVNNSGINDADENKKDLNALWDFASRKSSDRQS